MAQKDITCPDIGVDSAIITEILVAIGDSLQAGDSLITLESDKASMDVPAEDSGVVTAIQVKEGDALKQGDLILRLELSGSEENSSEENDNASKQDKGGVDAHTLNQEQKNDIPNNMPNKESVTEVKEPIQASEAAPIHTETTPETNNILYAGPATRRIARKLGIDLSQVSPSGARGRITQDDVFNYAKSRVNNNVAGVASSEPVVNIAELREFGEVSVEAMNRLQALTAEHMHKINLAVPQVTQFDEANIGSLEDFRQSLKQEAEKKSVRLTLLPFVMKICALLLRSFPNINSTIDFANKQLLRKGYYNIGFAVDTPNGLLVPVVRHVLEKSIWELAEEIMELAAAAKTGSIKPSHMQGGCFTISSLGNIGGTHFTPIVNAPEVAILGIGRARRTPICAPNGDVSSALILPLSLSYDHRVINGAEGARAANFIAQHLSDIRRLSLL